MTVKAQLTYRGLIDDATQLFYPVSDTPRIDAEVLMQHLLQRPLAWLLSHGDCQADSHHIKTYFELTARRQNGQPIAYITGHKEFWSLDLWVSEDVLIPRADTETLVEQALQKIEPATAVKILDLGTGSGAIALALAKERPLAEVLAVDSSPAALKLAQQNAQASSLGNVQFLVSDWFSNIEPQRFNLIAANPPYVASLDPHLEQGDLRFEPSAALIGGDDGLDDIRQIVAVAPDYLEPGAHLIVEHGHDQADAVAALFSQAGFGDVTLSLDLNSLPRCSLGVRN